MKKLTIVVLTFILSISALFAGSVEISDYIPATLKFIRIYIPLNEESGNAGNKYIDSRLPRLRIVLNYKGKIRDISKDEISFFNTIHSVNSNLSDLKETKKEILVSDGKDEFWIYVPDKLISSVSSTLKSGKLFTALVLYAGHSFKTKTDRAFILHAIDVSAVRPQSRDVYTDSLLDVKLGSELGSTLKTIVNKYGDPVDIVSTELMQKVYVFIIDKNSKTVLYVYDGGPELRNRVYALQLSTYNNSNRVFYRNLKLGADKNELAALFKSKYSFEKLDDDVSLMRLNNSDCSFEFKNDKLYSVYIAEDPYY